MEALQTVAEDFSKAGATLVAITPQRPAHSRALEKKIGLTFPILHDPANGVAEAYGLKFEFPDDLRGVYEGFGLDLPRHHGAGGWELPMPARYVVGTDGVVTYARVHPDYTQRPEPEDTLAALGMV